MSTSSTLEFNDICYQLPDGKQLFGPISFGLHNSKVGLVGRNGTGKTTILALAASLQKQSSGSINRLGSVELLPQTPKYSPNATVADALDVSECLQAIQRVYEGVHADSDYDIIGDDWDIEARVNNYMDKLGLKQLSTKRLLSTLSGGELTRVFLANLLLKEPDVLLLDEPTNNLDKDSRAALYSFIQSWSKSLIVVSHDRTLLNLVDQIWELSSLGLATYGGNYQFYDQKKKEEYEAALAELEYANLNFKKTNQLVQQKKEAKQHKDARGRQKRKTGNQTALFYNAQKARAEKTQSRLNREFEKQKIAAEKLKKEAYEKIEINDSLNFSLPNTSIPSGKQVLKLDVVSFRYPDALINQITDFSLNIAGPERIAVIGPNGSGKSTLLKIMLQIYKPNSGSVTLGVDRVACLDQHVQCLDHEQTILANFVHFNPELSETECRHTLAKFLFPNSAVFKIVKDLCGGELLRAALACLLMAKKPPQLLILDEPTNHWDLDSIKNIEQAIAHFEGALVVVSHDQAFLDAIKIQKTIQLPFANS